MTGQELYEILGSFSEEDRKLTMWVKTGEDGQPFNMEILEEVKKTNYQFFGEDVDCLMLMDGRWCTHDEVMEEVCSSFPPEKGVKATFEFPGVIRAETKNGVYIIGFDGKKWVVDKHNSVQDECSGVTPSDTRDLGVKDNEMDVLTLVQAIIKIVSPEE